MISDNRYRLMLLMQRTGFGPGAQLRALQASGTGVHRLSPNMWLVTRHADARHVLGSADYSTMRTHRPHTDPHDARQHERDVLPGRLPAFDPPEHTRLRRAFAPDLTPRRLRELEPRLHGIVNGLLDEMAASGSPVDLNRVFAQVPWLVTNALFDVPADEQVARVRLGTRLLDPHLSATEGRALDQVHAAHVRTLIRRAKADPDSGGMVATMLRAHDTLTDGELFAITKMMSSGGSEGLPPALALGTLALLLHPDQLAHVRDNPAAAGPAVDELLRWTQALPVGPLRDATTDTRLGGHTIPAGDYVAVSLPMANRDPAFVTDPDRLDITRGVPGHLGFGHGAHRCPGTLLSRMLLAYAFPALLQRFPRLRLAVPADNVRFAPTFVHSLHNLPVSW